MNHNTPNNGQNNTNRNRALIATAAALALAGGILGFEANNHSGSQPDAHRGQYTTSQLEGKYRYEGLPVVDPNDPDNELMLVGNTNAKAGDDVALTQDGGRTWDVIPQAPLDDLSGGSLVVDASFAGVAVPMNGNHAFEVTRVANKGATVDVEMDEITSNGTVVRVDTDEGNINFDNPHGNWSQDTAGDPEYTLSSVKGGGDMPTQLQVVASSGK